ncbi:2365_t:CDS:2 [Diversispora eburnea]|uniref:2365_t:CDS:1 n=1 Tax=Diversispora eburnea TaxID=1213867 RepID=A0A9N8UXX1_9GLOM|nr:2365_t:CDS:2 [Diversispora eburnea]
MDKARKIAIIPIKNAIRITTSIITAVGGFSDVVVSEVTKFCDVVVTGDEGLFVIVVCRVNISGEFTYEFTYEFT